MIIPFARDADFVEREAIFDEIKRRSGRPGSRTALVGLGGVGLGFLGQYQRNLLTASRKSQLAIEHAYRIRERSPSIWVFWIHASNATRFEQSIRNIANCVKIIGRQNPQANIFQLVHNWLQDKRKEPWVLILDNVDNAGFLVDEAGSLAAIGPAGDGQASNRKHVDTRPLLLYLP
jgi:hypothetical protein